jgi:hypothetical protein
MDQRTRRFGLADLLILIAAIGVATMSLRNLWQGLTIGPGARYWSVTPSRLILATTLSACATPMTFACLVFRFRRPRLTWRRVTIQPGTAALLTCLVIFAVEFMEVAAALIRPDVARLGTYEYGRTAIIHFGDSNQLVLLRSPNSNGVIGSIEPLACHGVLVATFARSCGPAVAAVWFVLALSGRWRPERSWIDRLGRLVGASWIVISILTALSIQ